MDKDAIVEKCNVIMQAALEIMTACKADLEKKCQVLSFQDFKKLSKGTESELVLLEGGSVRKRSDDRYEGRYFDENGERRSLYARTKTECINRVNAEIKRIRELERKTKSIRKNSIPTTFFKACESYLSVYKKPPLVTQRTADCYSSAFRNHIKPHISDVSGKQLTAIQLTDLIAKTNGRVKEDVITVIKGALKVLGRSELFDDVVYTKHKRAEGRALTADEEALLLSRLPASDRLGAFVRFLLWTGARKGEGEAVRKEDVDFEKDVLFLHGTKTENADRCLPLFEPVKLLLQSIDPDSNGKYFSGLGNVTKRLKAYLLERNLNVKDFRTTFTTKCSESGIPDQIIAKWMGHSDTYVTRKSYIKTRTAFELECAATVGKAFDPNLTPQKP